MDTSLVVRTVPKIIDNNEIMLYSNDDWRF